MAGTLNVLDEIGYDYTTERLTKDQIHRVQVTLESDVNHFGFKPEEIYNDFRENRTDLECRKAEFTLFRIALQWIHFWGTVSDSSHRNHEPKQFYLWVDGRNELAVKQCYRITQMEAFKGLFSDYGVDVDYTDRPRESEEFSYYKLMLEFNQHLHRTNMQTATQLMIYAVCTLPGDINSEKLRDALIEENGQRFYSLPMI